MILEEVQRRDTRTITGLNSFHEKVTKVDLLSLKKICQLGGVIDRGLKITDSMQESWVFPDSFITRAMRCQKR